MCTPGRVETTTLRSSLSYAGAELAHVLILPWASGFLAFKVGPTISTERIVDWVNAIGPQMKWAWTSRFETGPIKLNNKWAYNQFQVFIHVKYITHSHTHIRTDIIFIPYTYINYWCFMHHKYINRFNHVLLSKLPNTTIPVHDLHYIM